MTDKPFTPSTRQKELLSVVYEACPNPISMDEICESLNREKRLVGTTLKSLVKRNIINKSGDTVSIDPSVLIHENGDISFEDSPEQTTDIPQTTHIFEPEVKLTEVSPLNAPHPPLEEESIFNPEPTPEPIPESTPKDDYELPPNTTDSYNLGKENPTFTPPPETPPSNTQTQRIPPQNKVDDNMYQESQDLRKRTHNPPREIPSHYDENPRAETQITSPDDEPDIIPEIRSPHEILSNVLRKNEISEIFIESMYDLSLDQGILQPAELHLYLTTLRARKAANDKTGGSLKDAEASFIIRQYSRELDREKRKADRLDNLSQQFKFGSSVQPDYFTEQTSYPMASGSQPPYNRQNQQMPYGAPQSQQQGYNQRGNINQPNPLQPNQMQQNPQQQMNQVPPGYPQFQQPQPQGVSREDILYLQNEMKRDLSDSLREERERFNTQLDEERKRNVEEKNSFIEIIREMKEDRKEDRIAEAISEMKNMVIKTNNDEPKENVKDIIEAMSNKSDSQIKTLTDTMERNSNEEKERRKDDLYQRQLDEMKDERKTQQINMNNIISQLGKRNGESTISAYTDDVARLKAQGFQTFGDAVNKVANNKPLIILGSKALQDDGKESTEGEFEQYSDDTSEEVIENIPSEYIE